MHRNMGAIKDFQFVQIRNVKNFLPSQPEGILVFRAQSTAAFDYSIKNSFRYKLQPITTRTVPPNLKKKFKKWKQRRKKNRFRKFWQIFLTSIPIHIYDLDFQKSLNLSTKGQLILNKDPLLACSGEQGNRIIHRSQIDKLTALG